jgi:uncharacterized protein YbjT (DUF2867 family)
LSAWRMAHSAVRRFLEPPAVLLPFPCAQTDGVLGTHREPPAMDRIVTVFGGTGFLGSRVVRHLLSQRLSVRIASRHPDRTPSPSAGITLDSIFADVNDEQSVAAAVAGAYGVVNAVSLYVERGTETFHAVHVDAAERLARQAYRAGVERLAHVSGIGADAASGSLYIRNRGEGELAAQAAFANAIIIRPAVMFGQDDAFLNTLVKLLKRLPAYPMFGRGLTRLQPAYVEDVAAAIARAVQPAATQPVTYELGGPCVYTYEELLKVVAHRLRRKPVLFSVPFVWHALARIAEVLPGAPLSRNQVELMEVDNVASEGMPGFGALGIAPQPIEHALEQIILRG